MKFTIHELNDAIAEAQQTLDNLKRQKEILTSQEKETSILLHRKLCTQEDCNFLDDDWKEPHHQFYLVKTQKLLKFINHETLSNVLLILFDDDK